MNEKQELRAQLKEKRAAIPPEQKKALDRAIVNRIAASPVFQKASALLLYAPHGSEPNLLPLVRLARQMGKPVAFPRCHTADCTMQFYLLEPEKRLISGAYGIAEPPADAPLCEPDRYALCILPALSFDTTGARIGYGKGYYDRFLKTFPGVAVGAVYESMMLPKIPTEEHDRPVKLLFTEKATLRTQRQNPTASAKNKDTSPQNVPSHPLRVWNKCKAEIAKRLVGLRQKATVKKRAVVAADGATGASAQVGVTRKALHAPMILVLCTFLLLLLSRLIDTYLITRDNEYAVVVFLQLLIFVIPAVLYSKLRGDRFPERMRVRMIRPEHLWFTFCILMLMMTGGMLTGILTGGISSLSQSFTLYNTFVAHSDGSFSKTLYLLLAYGLLPAFCEELIFRSFLCAEYERFGVGVAVTVSSLLFAMLHFSLPLFLTYFCLGLLLSFAMYTTRSFLTSFLLHLLYNVFCLFGQPYLSAFYINAGSNRLFVFCLITLFLLFAAFAVGEARKIYHLYARANLDASYTVSLPLRDLPRAFAVAVASPVAAVCAVIWLVVAIVNLF